jgi:hypothetical protein
LFDSCRGFCIALDSVSQVQHDWAHRYCRYAEPNKAVSDFRERAYVEGGVGAGGVAGGELDAGGEVAVPVRVLRLETTPCTSSSSLSSNYSLLCRDFSE